jgi:diguanylate cyclase (GGDEF)-like protein
MAWGLAELIGGAGAAPLAAALAVGVVSLPLAALMLRLSREIEHRRRQLAILGGAEAPAGAANRSYFLALAERDWARARRYGGDPVLLIVDVDRFARLGETRGAEAGEIVLHEVARDIGRTLRSADALAHFGGSQIAVWLTQADPIGALDVADRIRERSEALDFGAQWRTLKITVSVGVAALRPAHQNLTALIADAEAAVQAARQAGGNCVRAAPVDPARGRRIGPSVGDNQAAGPV